MQLHMHILMKSFSVINPSDFETDLNDGIQSVLASWYSRRPSIKNFLKLANGALDG